MRRYFKISLLLLLLQPLFFLNVYAEEKEDSSTMVVDISLSEDDALERDFEKDYAIVQDIINSIPNDYTVDYTEENSFEDSSIIEELNNQIMDLLGNDWNTLVECGYSLSIYLDTGTGEDDFSIHQYHLYFQQESEDYSIVKPITVQYNNSSFYNEEDYQEINEVYSDPEIVYTEYVDFYTNEVIENQTSFDDYMDEYFSSLDVHYYYESLEDPTSLLLSEEDTGYTYIFKNELFYKLILTRRVVVSRMNVIDLVTPDNVLNEIKEKVEDYYDIELPKDDITLSEDYEVYSETMDSNLGIVEVEEIDSKEEKTYSVLNQSNYSLKKNQTHSISFKVKCIPEKFIKLLVNQVDISPKYYSFSSDKVVITLKNEYISLLDVGTYSILMVFSDGVANGKLTIWEEEKVQEVVVPVTYHYYDYSHYNDYHYYSSQPVEVTVVSEKEIIESEPPIENKEQITSIGDKLIPSEDKDIPIQIEEAEDKKEKKKFQFNRNFIPIIIVVVALVFGLFGGFLYKKSLED
jgi:hypothetical protein